MVDDWWVLLLVCALFALSRQLAGIERSARSTEAMVRRLLSDRGIEWESPVEPSDAVRKLASEGRKVAAIKAYRQQTGLRLKEAGAVVEAIGREDHPR